MIEVERVAEVRLRVAAWREAGMTVGFVPTMGYLHEGHLSLVRVARRKCDRVVVSIFVNPAQFGPGEDFEAYPRDPGRDRTALATVEGGVDLLFLPSGDEMYPAGHATSVEVAGVQDGLCGRSRAGHFAGVATVVAKLFGIVQPDVAVFGRKDAQQLAVIRRMVRDLEMPVEILGAEIVRERDGLALSSRNVYLSPAERERALVLPRTLVEAEERVAAGETNLDLLREELKNRLDAVEGVEAEYLEFVDAETMKPRPGSLESSPGGEGALLVMAAIRVGRTRLIDNRQLGRWE